MRAPFQILAIPYKYVDGEPLFFACFIVLMPTDGNLLPVGAKIMKHQSSQHHVSFSRSQERS